MVEGAVIVLEGLGCSTEFREEFVDSYALDTIWGVEMGLLNGCGFTSEELDHHYVLVIRADDGVELELEG